MSAPTDPGRFRVASGSALRPIDDVGRKHISAESSTPLRPLSAQGFANSHPLDVLNRRLLRNNLQRLRVIASACRRYSSISSSLMPKRRLPLRS